MKRNLTTLSSKYTFSCILKLKICKTCLTVTEKFWLHVRSFYDTCFAEIVHQNVYVNLFSVYLFLIDAVEKNYVCICMYMHTHTHIYSTNWKIYCMEMFIMHGNVIFFS